MKNVRIKACETGRKVVSLPYQNGRVADARQKIGEECFLFVKVLTQPDCADILSLALIERRAGG
jgi:hypothetical protein